MDLFNGGNMPDCTVQLWYNKQRVKKTGNISLYIQVIIGGEHSEVKLPALQWPAEKFDWETKKLLPRYANDPELVTFNAIIERERSKYWNSVLGFLKEDKPFTLGDIFKRAANRDISTQFCAFMTRAIYDRQKTTVKKDMIKESTAKAHKTALRWFSEFVGENDIPISKIDDKTLEKFANYVADHMSEGSVWTKIKNIKSYISYAFRHEKEVDHDYKRFIAEKPESDPTWLNEVEIRKLLDMYYGTARYANGQLIALTNEQKRDLRAFLFACFTGLRISDLCRWNKSWIIDDCIHFTPVKVKKSTKRPKKLIIPIIPIARQFIDDLSEDGFGIITHQAYNRNLKTIATIGSINKNVTSHVARHTFGTWLAIEGVPEMVISKLLGHSSVETTKIYIHLAKEYLAREIMKVQNRFSMRTVA